MKLDNFAALSMFLIFISWFALPPGKNTNQFKGNLTVFTATISKVCTACQTRYDVEIQVIL